MYIVAFLLFLSFLVCFFFLIFLGIGKFITFPLGPPTTLGLSRSCLPGSTKYENLDRVVFLSVIRELEGKIDSSLPLFKKFPLIVFLSLYLLLSFPKLHDDKIQKYGNIKL